MHLPAVKGNIYFALQGGKVPLDYFIEIYDFAVYIIYNFAFGRRLGKEYGSAANERLNVNPVWRD
jgi:hypothetical protein